ncbi:MAG: DUF4373 domain-containing protein [Clostridium sp.]|nr:DUF4373 domain-containing protein [Clostridium sp.]
MARPQKNGLDYFPLDVDIDQDDKIALIEAQHGVIGFAIIIKLLMKIYKNSYFYEWTEKEQLLFSKRINVDINSINVVINDCIKWGLFDSNLLETKKILTSKGVQARYLEAVGRRTKVEIRKEYLLLDENIVNAHKNLIIVDIKSNNEEVSDSINPQSKVKKSKVNNNKEDSCSGDFNIYKYMQQRGFVAISSIIAEQVQADIEMYSLEEVKQAIDIADNNGKHTYSYVKGVLEKRRGNGIDGSTRQDTEKNEDKWGKYEFE